MFCQGFCILAGLFVPAMLGKIIIFLGLVFEIHLGVRTFVFVVMLRSSVFRSCFANVFPYLLGFSVRESAWHELSSS